MMLRQLLIPEIKELIGLGDYASIKGVIHLWPAVETSDLISSLENKKDKIILFRLLNKGYAADVFSELNITQQKIIINSMKEREISNLLDDMEPDDRTSLFEELPSFLTKRILKLMNEDERKTSIMLLGYPKDSVGRLMTLEHLEINIHLNVADAIRVIKKDGRDSEIFDIAYIVDDNDKLSGFIDIKTLFFSDAKKKIKDVMKDNIISISVHEDQEKAVYLTKEYDLLVLPVVDSEDTLLGVITVDDIMDVVEEEYTEDMLKISGLSGSSVNLYEDIKNISVFKIYAKRIPWLLILIGINAFSTIIIGAFESTIAKYISLVFFMPLLISSGGNAGGQSATLIIRALAIKDISKNDWRPMFVKECSVSFLIAITMALSVSVIGFLRAGMMVSLVVGISMISIVLMGSLIGQSLPFIFSKMNIDPASSSVSLITSICDIVGITIYLTLATVLL